MVARSKTSACTGFLALVLGESDVLLQILRRCLAMADENTKERCAAVFERFKAKVGWLRLADAGLACDLCVKYLAQSTATPGKYKVSPFAAGTYVPGRYVYTRAFEQRAESSSMRKKALECKELIPQEPEPQAAEEEMEIPTRSKRPRLGRASSMGSSPKTLASDDTQASVGDDSAASSQGSREQASTSQALCHMILGACSVLFNGWACSVFNAMIDFGRLVGGLLPAAHDGQTVFSEVCNPIHGQVHEELTKAIRASPGYAI